MFRLLFIGIFSLYSVYAVKIVWDKDAAIQINEIEMNLARIDYDEEIRVNNRFLIFPGNLFKLIALFVRANFAQFDKAL